MGANECLIHTEFGGARLRDQNLTGPKCEKVDKFETIYLGISTYIDGKWFVIFEHTINCLIFGYVRLPQLENYFSCFLFLLFFFFLLMPFTFKPLNALYLKFERFVAVLLPACHGRATISFQFDRLLE